MAIYTKVSGASKSVTDAKVKVGGAWKQVNSIHTKVNGVWKEVWVGDYIALNVFYETTSYTTNDVYYNKLNSNIKKLTFKNIHIVVYGGSGNVIAEYNGDKGNTTGFTIELYNSNNLSVGYVTISYYPAEKMIRYLVSCDRAYDSTVSRVTLNIGAVVPVR